MKTVKKFAYIDTKKQTLLTWRPRNLKCYKNELFYMKNHLTEDKRVR